MKYKVISIILIMLCLFGIWAFLSTGRAGGEIGFYATVTNVEGNLV